MEHYVGIRSKPNVSFLLHMANVDTYTPHTLAQVNTLSGSLCHTISETRMSTTCVHTHSSICHSVTCQTHSHMYTHTRSDIHTHISLTHTHTHTHSYYHTHADDAAAHPQT